MTTEIFRQSTEKILAVLKTGKSIGVPAEATTQLPNGRILRCFVITKDIISVPQTINLFAQWRDKSNVWFPAQFSVTIEGTKKWAYEQLLHKPDRILFFLQVKGEKMPFGHVGLYRFDYQGRSCEIDNVIRGIQDKNTKGAMTIGLRLLIDWTFRYLHIKDLYLQVFSDNKKAIDLYSRLGFRKVSRVPLVSVIESGVTKWVETSKKNTHTFRYFVKMHLSKS